MTTKKTKGKAKTKKKVPRKRSTEKETTAEEIKIRMLGKSILVEHDLQEAERNAELKHGVKNPRLFYRNFVYRCEKCINEFEHETGIPIVEHEVVCPICEEVHVVKIVPVSRHYELKLPEKLKVIGPPKRKRKKSK